MGLPASLAFLDDHQQACYRQAPLGNGNNSTGSVFPRHGLEERHFPPPQQLHQQHPQHQHSHYDPLDTQRSASAPLPAPSGMPDQHLHHPHPANGHTSQSQVHINHLSSEGVALQVQTAAAANSATHPTRPLWAHPMMRFRGLTAAPTTRSQPTSPMHPVHRSLSTRSGDKGPRSPGSSGERDTGGSAGGLRGVADHRSAHQSSASWDADEAFAKSPHSTMLARPTRADPSPPPLLQAPYLQRPGPNIQLSPPPGQQPQQHMSQHLAGPPHMLPSARTSLDTQPPLSPTEKLLLARRSMPTTALSHPSSLPPPLARHQSLRDDCALRFSVAASASLRAPTKSPRRHTAPAEPRPGSSGYSMDGTPYYVASASAPLPATLLGAELPAWGALLPGGNGEYMPVPRSCGAGLSASAGGSPNAAGAQRFSWRQLESATAGLAGRPGTTPPPASRHLQSSGSFRGGDAWRMSTPATGPAARMSKADRFLEGSRELTLAGATRTAPVFYLDNAIRPASTVRHALEALETGPVDGWAQQDGDGDDMPGMHAFGSPAHTPTGPDSVGSWFS